MSIFIDKEHTGNCPVNNELHTIKVTYLSGGSSVDTNGNIHQKQSFSCDNSNCEHFLNNTCPIFKEIPFTSVF